MKKRNHSCFIIGFKRKKRGICKEARFWYKMGSIEWI